MWISSSSSVVRIWLDIINLLDINWPCVWIGWRLCFQNHRMHSSCFMQIVTYCPDRLSHFLLNDSLLHISFLKPKTRSIIHGLITSWNLRSYVFLGGIRLYEININYQHFEWIITLRIDIPHVFHIHLSCIELYNVILIISSVSRNFIIKLWKREKTQFFTGSVLINSYI